MDACFAANGCTVNAYDPSLSPGGSSGGSGSAVATFIAPVALTEDTGGGYVPVDARVRAWLLSCSCRSHAPPTLKRSRR